MIKTGPSPPQVSSNFRPETWGQRSHVGLVQASSHRTGQAGLSRDSKVSLGVSVSRLSLWWTGDPDQDENLMFDSGLDQNVFTVLMSCRCPLCPQASLSMFWSTGRSREQDLPGCGSLPPPGGLSLVLTRSLRVLDRTSLGSGL